MIELSEQLLIDLSVLSKKDAPEVRALYRAAAEQLDLEIIDYLTIRDLANIAGRRDLALHLVLIAMFQSRNQGSVCLTLERGSLMRKLEPLAGAGIESALSSLPEAIAGCAEIVFVKDTAAPALLTSPRDEFKPLILVSDGTAHRLYFQKYYAAEQAVTGAINAALARDRSPLADRERMRVLIKEILEDNPAETGAGPAILNPRQKLGIVLPLLKNFVLISGGPGTGKTFIVFSLARLLIRLGVPAERIKIAAPTGRAAQKLTDAVSRGLASLGKKEGPDRQLSEIQATTLHRLLRYSPARNSFLFNRYNRIPADVIIIDEASMIDIVLLGRLFEALEDNAGIVLLGDRDQLPSVEAGAVLADLIPDSRDRAFSGALSGMVRDIYPDLAIDQGAAAEGTGDPLADRVIILTESYRSDESIKRLARGINSRDDAVLRDIPALDPSREFPESGVWRIEPAENGLPYQQDIRRVAASWALHNYARGAAGATPYRELVMAASGLHLQETGGDTASKYLEALFARLDDARILTPLRSGLSGTAGINGHIAGSLGGMFDPTGKGGLFAGAPVIITQNDYSRGLFNGDVGVVLPGADGQYYCLFQRPDSFARHPVEALPPHELSFAITVHKSQGSEYGKVLLVLPEGAPASLRTREIVYTAVTRAKKLLVFYARAATLREAIHSTSGRESGIRL